MPKKNLHIFILLAFLVLVGMIVSPVCAGYTITAVPYDSQDISWGSSTGLVYDASQNGMAIQRIAWDLPTGTTIDYTLWYGNGSTTSGQMIYTNVGLMQQHTEVSMGGVTSEYDYIGVGEIGRLDIAGYAKNETSTGVYERGLIIYDSVFALSDMKCVVFQPTTGIGDGVIYKVEWHSNRPVHAAVFTNPRSVVVGAVSKSPVDQALEWINFAISIGGTIKDLAFAIFKYAKFFLWDHLALTIALYIAITGAISFRARGDIFAKIKRFFRYQRSMYEFILARWNDLVTLIANFRGILRL